MRNQGSGTEELYDFTNDLLERWNLAGVAEGEALLPRYRAALTALGGGPPRARHSHSGSHGKAF